MQARTETTLSKENTKHMLYRTELNYVKWHYLIGERECNIFLLLNIKTGICIDKIVNLENPSESLIANNFVCVKIII